MTDNIKPLPIPGQVWRMWSGPHERCFVVKSIEHEPERTRPMEPSGLVYFESGGPATLDVMMNTDAWQCDMSVDDIGSRLRELTIETYGMDRIRRLERVMGHRLV